MTYAEQLKDARWIARRKDVYERAGHRCQECAATGVRLEAHHLYYERGKAPWEYPDSALRCLCTDCHANATHEQQLLARSENVEVKRDIAARQAVQQVITGLASGMGFPKKPKKLREAEVWDIIKSLGDAKSRPMMSCLVRLSHRGVPDAALLEIATHYSENHESIENPFAYYSQRGFATVGAVVKAQDREHAETMRQDAAFFGRKT